MKFAKTLEDVMVPEWRSKYVEYKIGKKRIKTTTNNIRNASSTPAINALRLSILSRATSLHTANPDRAALNRESRYSARASGGYTLSWRYSLQFGSAPPPPIPGHQTGRRRSSYGSSGFSPGFQPDQPTHLVPDHIQPVDPPTFDDETITLWPALSREPSEAGADNHRNNDNDDSPSNSSVPRGLGHGLSSRLNAPPLLKRLFTLGRVPAVQSAERMPTIAEVQAVAEKEFLRWLLGELKKCEDFYQTREDEAVRRFNEMHEQLEIMRDRWFRDKHGISFEEDDAEGDETLVSSDRVGASFAESSSHISGSSSSRKKWVGRKTFSDPLNGLTRPYPTAAQVNAAVIKVPEGTKDYVRRPPARKPLNNPPHRVARGRLKRAYIGYYHGLEMLKSYMTVNRECFRKITKKFDKASGLRTSHRFMTEYVDKSKFGGAGSGLDDLLNDTEALFARFFEKGNRKEAAARLRPRETKAQFYSSVGRTGAYLGSALVIGLYALYSAQLKLKLRGSERHDEAVQMGYLLQIWGGISLFLLQAMLFTINLRAWSRNRINYAFIFEFDPRHRLNYRQYLELPALLSLIFAICFWFSSMDFWNGRMDAINWPIIYLSIAIAIIINPFKVLYPHSRLWLVQTVLRVLVSGAYPVEFRDFWVGDLLCSQTYALGNISLFFCLYNRAWHEPDKCDSKHSRLLGFFTTLPAIWRLLQCIRRYCNSGMWFPHLANGAKYTMTILNYMTLSIWRLQMEQEPAGTAKTAFIACASLNSIFTTIWDIVMDWSLMDPSADRPLLRKSLGFDVAWPYYLAMLVDPIIRSSWFFYIIYAGQNPGMQSYILALAEVLRRFMWCFFRVENEHVGNVGANRAYRVIQLPYHLPSESPPPVEEELSEPIGMPVVGADLDLEQLDPGRRRKSKRSLPGSPIVRTIAQVGRTMNQAHLQDYERRRSREEEPDLSGESDEEEDFYERTRNSEARLSRARSAIIDRPLSGAESEPEAL